MSFDGKQQSDDDEINLAEFFRNIWFYKFSLLTFILLSVPISIMYSGTLEPKYKAETVFKHPNNDNAQSNNSLLGNVEGLGFLNVLRVGSAGRGADSFFSEIRSESFLKTVILNNAELDRNMLMDFCPLPTKETTQFSLRSLLISLGIVESRAPSEMQKISLIVQCVNNMLEIDFDNHGSVESSAYRLSIESGDPNFSANLANQIVDKYFIRYEKVRDQNFENIKKYLSKVITEAQVEFAEADKLMQRFKIKHSLLMNIQTLSSQNSNKVAFTGGVQIPESPFIPELNKEIANLSQLEKSLNQLKKARLNLSNLKELNQENIKRFISSSEVQGVFSRTFITAITKINNFTGSTRVINQEIKKIVSQELQSLKEQIVVLEEKIGKREEQTMQLMNIENTFQELAIDVSKKKLIFEGLKDQLKEKILNTGLANVDQPVLLTKAVAPFSKSSPNRKLIVVLGVVLFMFIGISFILIRQLSLKRVYSLSQLQKLNKFLTFYRIKYKQLKQTGERSDETAIDQSFFSLALEIGKLGCIIDLSKERQNNSLASEFSKTIASLLATENSKVVCLESSQSKKPFFASSQKSFGSDNNKLNVPEVLGKNILLINDEDGLVSDGEIGKIKNKYSEHDKIVCALGAEIGDLTKYKFIEQCDFYILIGRSFQFNEFTFKKFSNTVLEKENKCLGFFLID